MTNRCTHPDRGSSVAVECPTCHTVVKLPTDRPDRAEDRRCVVCNTFLPYLPEVPRAAAEPTQPIHPVNPSDNPWAGGEDYPVGRHSE